MKLGKIESFGKCINHTFLGENSQHPNPHPKEIYNRKETQQLDAETFLQTTCNKNKALSYHTRIEAITTKKLD